MISGLIFLGSGNSVFKFLDVGMPSIVNLTIFVTAMEKKETVAAACIWSSKIYQMNFTINAIRYRVNLYSGNDL